MPWRQRAVERRWSAHRSQRYRSGGEPPNVPTWDSRRQQDRRSPAAAPNYQPRDHRGHPAMPDALDDRAADNWEPLLAIADLAGGDYPKLARSAALHLSGSAEIDEQTIGVQLLAAAKALFDTLAVDRITSERLA